MPRFVYICGSGHSGSTLLEMFLAAHPRFAAVGELQNLSHQIAIGRVCSCGVLPNECLRWQGVRDAVLACRGVDIFAQPRAFRVSRERPQSWTERSIRLWNRACYYTYFGTWVGRRLRVDRLVYEGRAMRRNTALVVEAIRKLSGADIVVDSSKDYVRMREMYDAVRPGEGKVIYLTRDGRGCVWSAVKRQLATVETIAREWAKNQVRTQHMLKGVRPEDQLWVRYEDLCRDVRQTLQMVCSFLGVDYREAMLALQPKEHHTIAGNQIRVQRAMQVKLDEAWRENLTSGQLRTFERIAGTQRRKLGYDAEAEVRSTVRLTPARCEWDAAAPARDQTTV